MKKNLLTGVRFSSNNRIKVYQSGPEFFQELEARIVLARQEIHLQTYILKDDETGHKVIRALQHAAERGVHVFMLLDAYGSRALPTETRQLLLMAGVHLRVYGRFFSFSGIHLGRRLHRKVVVIDGKTAFVGGMNISNHYNRINEKHAWLDFTVLVEGDAAARLRSICKQSWRSFHFHRLGHTAPSWHLTSKTADSIHTSVGVLQNDFLGNKQAIANTYRQCIRRAEQSIVLIGGYFLPGGAFRRALRAAVRRGVNIDVVLAAKSDVAVSAYAREYLQRWLIRNGIHIHEYLPANVHGKVLLIDDRFVTIGSYDLNNLSTYSNIELNLAIDDERFAALMRERIIHIIAHDCRPLTLQMHTLKSSYYRQLLRWLSYRIAKTFFGISHLLSSKDR